MIFAIMGVILWHNNAIAQFPGDFNPGGPPPFDPEEMLREFDTNGDGVLSEEELRMAPQRFNDRPGPPFGRGFDDRVRGGPGFGPGFGQENLLEKFDSDKDGSLNDDERKVADANTNQINNNQAKKQNPKSINKQPVKVVKGFPVVINV